jgi:hypothetical protein
MTVSSLLYSSLPEFQLSSSSVHTHGISTILKNIWIRWLLPTINSDPIRNADTTREQTY